MNHKKTYEKPTRGGKKKNDRRTKLKNKTKTFQNKSHVLNVYSHFTQ